MDGLGKKMGFIKGLLEGMEFSDASNEKLIRAMADLLGDMCDRIEAQDELLDDLNDYVESIDDDLALLEGEKGDDDGFHYEDDEVEEAYEDAYMNGMEDFEERLHLLDGKKARSADDDGEPEVETLAGGICPECKRMFFVGTDDPEDAQYACPHCGKQVTPDPLTPENAPIARPIED